MTKDPVLKTAHVVASIAHDLRSPLNAVVGFARVLLKGIDGPLSDQQTADLEAIYSNGNAMLEMVNDLVDIAKAESGWLSPSPTVIYLPSLFEKVLYLVKPSLSKEIDLVIEATDASLFVQADLAQLQSALQGFLVAAAHLVGVGSVTLAAKVWGENAVVQITGLASEELTASWQAVLNAFHSSGMSPQSRLDAIGLRLLVGKQWIALNGGAFHVDDLSERRIALTFSMPLAAQQPQDPSLAQPRA
jgi:K+-sensing histidine kinase KdpD